MVQLNLAWFCNWGHAAKHGKELAEKAKSRAARKAEIRIEKKKKAARSANRLRKKETMKRSEWYDKLQAVVNQFVLSVRDKDKPCYTCGKLGSNQSYGKHMFDAGHLYTRAARSDIRFELTGLHKQCVSCNDHGSGMRVEYEAAIIREYGEKHLEWLQERKPDLKVQFPHWTDIDKEIIRYRALLRSHGIRPNA